MAQQVPIVRYPQDRVVYTLGNPISPLLIQQTGGGPIDDSPSGLVSTYAGSTRGFSNGLGTAAKFNRPTGITVAPDGTLFIADCFNNSIRKIAPNGDVSTFAGFSGNEGRANGTINAEFFRPFNLAYQNITGNIYVADSYNNQIRKIAPGGVVSHIAGDINGDEDSSDGQGRFGRFNNPTGIAFSPLSDLIYITDTYNSTIRQMTLADAEVITFAGTAFGSTYVDGPRASARFNNPNAIAIDALGNIFIADYLNHCIRKIEAGTGIVSTYAGDGTSGTRNGSRLQARFDHPTAIAINFRGDVFVCDDNEIIREISASTGEVITIAGSGNQGSADGLRWESSFFRPIGLAFDRSGSLFVADQDNDRIRKITFGGGFSIDKPLPQGMIFNERTGAITGTPTEASPEVTYTVTAHGVFGDGFTEIRIAVITPPLVTITPADPAACAGTSILFKAVVTGGGSNPTYQWMVDGVNAGTDSDEFDTGTTISDGAVISCVVTNNDVAGAPSVSLPAASAAVVLTPNVTVSLNISSAQQTQVCPGYQIRFNATLTPELSTAVTYNWQVNGVTAGGNEASFSSSALEDGDEVTCTVSVSGPCLVNSNLTSNVIIVDLLSAELCAVLVPSAFSPNGDGRNDTWMIPALLGYPTCMVDVFGRDGQLVFHSYGYSIPWDGTKKGKQLPVGVYYYVIGISPGQKKLSGHISIIR
ncbi:MAG TPA: gliding motility-associated C-terminal domain-containing protein [Pedobacter sp.]|nr:gliding motility-associated C-terminal domain-containing protein [Pedobacter sp.]